MKKSRMILLLAVIALVLLNGTTAFAATYSSSFWNGYTTKSSVAISDLGDIWFYNEKAQFEVYNMWIDGSAFKTSALHNGSSYSSIRTEIGTERSFNWAGGPGTGKLRFDNDYSPWTNYKLYNKGEFF